MDFGMSCEELIGDKSKPFSQFTEAFFRKVGLDNILSSGKNFEDESQKDELLKVTYKIIQNIYEAKTNIIDKILADSEAKAKSFIVLQVNPKSQRIDLNALANKILCIEMEGLHWETEWKKVSAE